MSASAPTLARDSAAALGVTSSAVTQSVDVLRSAVWVTSEVNPDDRRARIVRLTDTAASELEAFRQDCVSSLAPRFDALTAAEMVELGRLLRKVTQPLEARCHGAPPSARAST